MSAIDPIADMGCVGDCRFMDGSNRIGALNIADAISQRIGSYVDLHSIEFLAVEDDIIHCWYQSPLADGPGIQISIDRGKDGWSLEVKEHPSGTEQQIEVP